MSLLHRRHPAATTPLLPASLSAAASADSVSSHHTVDSAAPHDAADDAYGLFIGTLFAAMGKAFGFQSAVVSVAIGIAVGAISYSLDGSSIGNGFAAIAGGTFLGMGILCLARHNASMGGTGALALTRQFVCGVLQAVENGFGHVRGESGG